MRQWKAIASEKKKKITVLLRTAQPRILFANYKYTYMESNIEPACDAYNLYYVYHYIDRHLDGTRAVFSLVFRTYNSVCWHLVATTTDDGDDNDDIHIGVYVRVCNTPKSRILHS